MKRVSILVPVFRVEQYIERCARSLFEQSYQELEFVFVNDCSPDRSIDVLQEVMKDYPERMSAVSIVNHKENKGLAASRNTVLDHSHGEFVIYVDSDDWLDINTIEILMSKQSENDADMVSGNRLVHYNDGSINLQEKEYKDREQMTLQMMQHTWDHFITGRLIRRSLFVNNGLRWQDGHDVAEDRYMMTLLAYHVRAFSIVDRVVYHYERRNINAMTTANDSSRIIRNNRQEFENVLSLEQFFSDQKTVFKEESTRCVMEQLKYYLQSTIASNQKKEFYNVVDIIDHRCEADLKLIGWEKQGLKGWIRHNYQYMVVVHYKNKFIRFIKRKAKAFIAK